MRERTRLTVNLRMVSPLLLGGADSSKLDTLGDGAGWLRPPSLKPQLRFWFRAVAAPLVNLDIQVLREIETRVWGATDHPGPRLRVFGTIPRMHGMQEPTALLLPHSDPPVGRNVFWPLATRRTARIIIESTSDTAAFERAIAASVWLWANLGALGKRARRGFGSFEITSWEGSPGFATPDFPIAETSDAEALRSRLHRGFTIAQTAIADAIRACGPTPACPATSSANDNAMFHVADAAQIRVGNTAWAAEPYDQPHQGPIDRIMSSCHAVMHRSYANYHANVGAGGNAGRLASPLWIRLAPLPDDANGPRVVPVATHGRGGAAPTPIAQLLTEIDAT